MNISIEEKKTRYLRSGMEQPLVGCPMCKASFVALRVRRKARGELSSVSRIHEFTAGELHIILYVCHIIYVFALSFMFCRFRFDYFCFHTVTWSEVRSCLVNCGGRMRFFAR